MLCCVTGSLALQEVADVIARAPHWQAPEVQVLVAPYRTPIGVMDFVRQTYGEVFHRLSSYSNVLQQPVLSVSACVLSLRSCVGKHISSDMREQLALFERMSPRGDTEITLGDMSSYVEKGKDCVFLAWLFAAAIKLQVPRSW